MKPRTSFLLTLVILAIAAAPQSARACAACMGDPNSDIAGAANAAVFSMLGLVGGMLGCISVCGYNLYRRSIAPVPPHAQIADESGEPPEGGNS